MGSECLFLVLAPLRPGFSARSQALKVSNTTIFFLWCDDACILYLSAATEYVLETLAKCTNFS